MFVSQSTSLWRPASEFCTCTLRFRCIRHFVINVINNIRTRFIISFTWYVLWYIVHSVVYTCDLILARIWLLGLCPFINRVLQVLKASWGPPNMLSGTKYINYTSALLGTIGSTGAIEIVDLISTCIQRDRPTGASELPQSVGCTDAKASVKTVLQFFLIFSWIDLELNVTSIVSSSKHCVNFYWSSWAVFERVCKISKANSIFGQATNSWTPLNSTDKN